MFACLATIGLLSVAFRAPALRNAGTVNSDAAIVGLQARHVLAGHLPLFLYGSGYQTSVDSVVAAGFFALLGASAAALVASTLAGHIAATFLVFTTLRRRLPWRESIVAVLPIVFTSAPLHTYILNPPRQAALTLAFAAVYVTDGAAGASPRSRPAFAFGGAMLAGLACFADPYALLVWPCVVLLGVMSSLDDGAVGRGLREAGRAVAPVLAGAAVGLVPFALLLRHPQSVHGEASLTFAVLRHNLSLLFDPCLPWLLGATAYVPRGRIGYVPWGPGALVRAVQWAGAAVFLAAVLRGLWPWRLRRSEPDVPWPIRRLGLFGALVAVMTVVAFLLSVMVMDLFSSRYLAALVLFAPFALAPVCARLGWRRAAGLLAASVFASGACGWLGFGDEVNGLAIVRLPGGGGQDEVELSRQLEARGVQAAIADYWVCYRMTFLARESLLVVPLHAREDRYPPYRQAYRQATRTAYVYDPARSREDFEALRKDAFDTPQPWGEPVERLEVGGLRAVVFDKRAGEAPGLM